MNLCAAFIVWAEHALLIIEIRSIIFYCILSALLLFPFLNICGVGFRFCLTEDHNDNTIRNWMTKSRFISLDISNELVIIFTIVCLPMDLAIWCFIGSKDKATQSNAKHKATKINDNCLYIFLEIN